jgi:membrane-bound metal-dependent hydrolase YbcI (DUF457 family)
MPDLLTHYVAGLLISSRLLRLRYAMLIALVGLLPDIDVLFRIHRWITHSLVITSIISLIIAMITLFFFRRYFQIMILATILYILHIILDLFTASTPILWPIYNNAIMIKIGVDGILRSDKINIVFNSTLYYEPADFSQRDEIEGPLISGIGVILIITTMIILLVEYYHKYYHRKSSAHT